MEILQNIWQALTTPNENLINIFMIPLSFIEIAVGMLLFTTLLNIESTKKKKITYILFLSIYTIISSFLIPKSFLLFINILTGSIIIYFIFKPGILKAIIAQIIPLISTALIETILLRVYLIIFKQEYEQILSIPFYRISFILILYLIMFLIYKILKFFKIHIILSDSLNKKSKILLILTSIMGLITIAIQFYLIIFLNDKLPLHIILLTTLSLISYFFISFYSLIKTSKLEITKQNLEEAKLYNKSLKILYDNIRAFRHDFSNIVQALNGYVESKDFDGLKEYYSELLEDCKNVNNLETLNPELINNPAIYSILASKYHKADEIGIKINLNIFLDLNELKVKIYDFTRILGILLDNAIEAASNCEEKIINVQFSEDNKAKRQLVIIQNTYTNKDVDTERIFEKGYTSKEGETEAHGLGLWEVKKLLMKSNNLNLYTTKDDKYFTQQLEIY